jgi:hypothetical protein
MRDLAPRRLFDEIDLWAEKSITQHSAGLDGLRWQVSMVHLPNPSANPDEPRLTSAPAIFIQVPTGKGIQTLANTIIVSPGSDEEYITNIIAEALDSMRRSLTALGEGFAVPEADLNGAGPG